MTASASPVASRARLGTRHTTHRHRHEQGRWQETLGACYLPPRPTFAAAIAGFPLRSTLLLPPAASISIWLQEGLLAGVAAGCHWRDNLPTPRDFAAGTRLRCEPSAAKGRGRGIRAGVVPQSPRCLPWAHYGCANGKLRSYPRRNRATRPGPLASGAGTRTSSLRCNCPNGQG